MKKLAQSFSGLAGMYSRKLSLKIKVTGLVLLLFLCTIWLLTYVISIRLEQDMTTQIEEQQFSVASFIADSIENQVKLRIHALTTVASRITPELIAKPGRLGEFLYDKPLLPSLFQSGVVVLSLQGKVLADYPVLKGRLGGNLSDREYFIEVVATGKPSVGRPLTGRYVKRNQVGFAVPVLDRSGKLIAVLAGFTLVSDPAFVGTIESSVYKDFPDRLTLVSPKYRMFITGSDPSRIMTPTPGPGVNPLFDRFMAGFEGSGITVNARKIKVLVSAKYIPTPGWFIGVRLPAKIAFASIHKMKIWSYSMALGLSLLSSLFVWFVIRMELRPLYAASRLMQDITEERVPLQNIPVTRYDEVGQLLTSFNVHLNYRMKAETAMAEALAQTRRFSEALDRISAFIYMKDRQRRYVYANRPTLELFNCSAEELRGSYDSRFFPPDTVAQLYAVDTRTLEHGEDTADEIVSHAPDGSRRVYWEVKTPIYDEADKDLIWGLCGISTDITERKQIENALKDSEYLLRHAASIAHMGTWKWNLQDNSNVWSEEQFRIFGVPNTVTPSSDVFYGTLHPDDRDKVKEAVRQALLGANSYEVECRVVWPNGEIRHVHCQGEVQRNEDGRPLSMMGTVLDITELKNKEEALRIAEERSQFALEGSGAGVWDWNLQTNESFVSGKYKTMLGYSDTAVIGYDEWVSMMHPEDKDGVLAATQAYLDGTAPNFISEYRIRCEDGSWKWVLSHGMVVSRAPDGRPLRMTGTQTDITDRKKAEEEREQFFKFFTSSDDLMAIADPNGCFKKMNPACLRVLGYSEEELLSKPFVDFVHPEDRQATLDEMARQIQRGYSLNFENRYVCKDGSVRNLSWHANFVAREGITYATARDITEAKRAEELIKQSLREKETLLREIHHRVKNNMAVVSSLLSLQANSIKDLSVRHLFEESQQRVKSMALVHEKLYGTKDLSSINFKDYIKTIVQEIMILYHVDSSAIATEINIEDIELDLESAVPCALIINELLTNAFKYAFAGEKGGVLSICFTKVDSTYTLTVRDNGVGLPEGFDEKETDTLGLQIVNVLTKQLRGTLQIKSDEGTEAVVTFSTRKK
ncbi:MAG: PAS domain-containing protein [Nitrospirae bacterium]|nr:PAS domain-containing protein [Nitrospirota bacterium]